MDDLSEKSLALHKQNHGKLAIAPKVTISSMADLTLLYSPGVAAVSKALDQNPSLAHELTMKGNTVAVISDGSAILGLGNLGPLPALPVMEGKAVLFKQFAGLDAIPICLDTQDSEEIIKTIKLLSSNFGAINLEDIAAPRCFEIETRLKNELNIPVMHDDQHGTAVVVLAALINICKLKNLIPDKCKIVINGAGAAGFAITELISLYGYKDIIICDSKGVINSKRKDLNKEKQTIVQLSSKLSNNYFSLKEALVNADIFIGVSKGGLLTEEMVRSMASQPAIIAMANPEPEIMPDKAKAAGAFIVATGRSDFPNQVNNVLAFPGIFRGAIDNKVKQITKAMLINAAKALAEANNSLSPEKILPSVFDSSVVPSIANAIKD